MEGIHTIESHYSVKETADRIVKQIEMEDWHLFARIDHSGQAREKGIELRPTEVVLFGNPAIGTRLMLDNQTSAIDLPVKALVWEDEEGKVTIGYNTTDWLKKRHHLSDQNTLKQIGAVLYNICSRAAAE